jgi:hypothetical protein
LNATRRISIEVLAGLLSFAILACDPAAGAQANPVQNVVRIDATAPAPAPQPVEAQLGSNRNPRGETIGVNSQYLTLAARLYRDTQLLDDNFWNGLPWEVGLRETLANWPTPAQEFDLRILPLPANAPMYLEQRTDGRAMPAAVVSVNLVPEYRLDVPTAPLK